MTAPTVTRRDIADGFVRLGLRAGDVLFYHSSLKRFGRVDGGADAVVDAMLDVLTPAGTLAAPAFTFKIKERPDPVLDIRNEPSAMGATAEALRRRSGACRSHHLTHSVAAVGARAAELTAEHSATPCGPNSPFAKLLAWGARIALIGCDQNVNTCFHAIEQELALPHTGFRTIAGAAIIDEAGRRLPLPTEVHNSTTKYDFNFADRPLYDAGAMTITTVGGAIIRLIRGRQMRDWAVPALTADPALLLIHGEAWMWRPTLAGDIERF